MLKDSLARLGRDWRGARNLELFLAHKIFSLQKLDDPPIVRVMKTLALVSLLGVFGCQGPAGAPGADGQMGAMGLPGSSAAKGDKGDTGAIGPAGAQGPAGKDGQSVTDTLQAVLDKVVPKRTAIVNAWCWHPCDGATPVGECTPDNKQWIRGTATKLTDGRALTAEHITHGATSCMLVDEKNLEAGQAPTWTQPSPGKDVVLLNVTWSASGTALPSFSVVSGKTPALGEMVMLASYPETFAKDLQMSFGYVTDTEIKASLPAGYETQWAGSWAFDGAATRGSSGGPVFSAAGDLIGILVGGSTDPQLVLRYVLPLGTL